MERELGQIFQWWVLTAQICDCVYVHVIILLYQVLMLSHIKVYFPWHQKTNNVMIDPHVTSCGSIIISTTHFTSGVIIIYFIQLQSDG